MAITICLVLFGTVALADIGKAPTISSDKVKITDTLQQTSQQANENRVKGLKDYLYSLTTQYGGNYYQLVKLVQCEGGWGANKKNPKSTASGPAQFLNSTWNGYCTGDKDDQYAQIRCLVRAWNEGYQSWWSESKSCWNKYQLK